MGTDAIKVGHVYQLFYLSSKIQSRYTRVQTVGWPRQQRSQRHCYCKRESTDYNTFWLILKQYFCIVFYHIMKKCLS